jgi:hypothetical protein
MLINPTEYGSLHTRKVIRHWDEINRVLGDSHQKIFIAREKHFVKPGAAPLESYKVRVNAQVKKSTKKYNSKTNQQTNKTKQNRTEQQQKKLKQLSSA